MKTPKILDESVFIGCKQVLGVALSCVCDALKPGGSVDNPSIHGIIVDVG